MQGETRKNCLFSDFPAVIFSLRCMKKVRAEPSQAENFSALAMAQAISAWTHHYVLEQQESSFYFRSCPKMVSFLSLQLRKRYRFWCSQKNFEPFLFCDGFSSKSGLVSSHLLKPSSFSLPSFGPDYSPLNSANFSIQTEVKLGMLQHSKENFLIPHSRLFSLLFAHQKNPKIPNSFFDLLFV